ncbi:hypothetical protein AB0F43_05875 [Kribbella sp. NPDC023972]
MTPREAMDGALKDAITQQLLPRDSPDLCRTGIAAPTPKSA